MIVGIGTDIVEIKRITKLLSKRKKSFVERILSSSEMQEYDAQMHPEKYLAKRWAAKEAVSKALGTGITQGVAFTDITVGHLESGQPVIMLEGKTAEISNQKNISRWSISISDEKQHAIAFVVAESNE